jgi:enamine deaminase RidA (YjgF/YER057c/UK114 family)
LPRRFEAGSSQQIGKGPDQMDRTDVNPWEWSKRFGFSQAVEVRGTQRVLWCSGQTAIGEDGSPPTSPDMGNQVRTAFENLTTVLETAGMSMEDVIRITYYTTDVDELVAVLRDIASGFFGDNLVASTLLGVSQLAFPEIKIEIEAVAAQ